MYVDDLDVRGRALNRYARSAAEFGAQPGSEV
jgi:hypothetical protein